MAQAGDYLFSWNKKHFGDDRDGDMDGDSGSNCDNNDAVFDAKVI